MPAVKTSKNPVGRPKRGKVRVRVRKGCKGFDGLQIRSEGDEFMIDVSSLKLEGAAGTIDTASGLPWDSVECGKDTAGNPVRYSLGSWLEDAKRPVVIEPDDDETTGVLQEPQDDVI